MFLAILFLLALPLLLIVWLYYFDNVILQRKFGLHRSSDTNLPQRIPGPSVFSWLRDTFFPSGPKIHHTLVQRKQYEKYGKETGMFLVPIPLAPAITVCSPELVRKVFANAKVFPKVSGTSRQGSLLHMFMGSSNLVFSNGEDWKRQRTIMNPTFLNIDRFAPIFVEKTNEALQVMYEQVQQKEAKKPIPLHNWMTKMALDILGTCVFDYDFETMHSDKNQDYVNSYFLLMNNLTNIVRNLFPFLNRVPTESTKALRKAVSTLDHLIYDLIDQARKKKNQSGTQGNTLLDVLLDAAQQHQESSVTLSETELRDNIVIFFVAGSETTANALSFELYFLAKHPEMQEKMYQEILSVVGEDAIPTSAQCKDYEYMNMFINETLRFYHPAGQVTPKLTTEDTELNGYRIPKGTLIMLALHSTHHHSSWEDPDVFRPERFATDAKRPSNAYYPFGGGNRICIGNTFSILEQQIFLTMCLQRYKVSLKNPNYEIQLAPYGSTIQPDVSLEIILTPRN